MNNGHHLLRELSQMGQLTINTENDENLSIPTLLMAYNGSISREKCAKLLDERLLPNYDRFKCKVSENKKLFILDEDFKVINHIFEHPNIVDKTELDQLIGSLTNKKFTEDRPLWDVHLIITESKNTVMFFRLHHCYADGMTFLMALYRMSDDVYLLEKKKAMNEGKNNEKEEKKEEKEKVSFKNKAINFIKASFVLLIGVIIVLINWIHLSIFASKPPEFLKPKQLSKDKSIGFYSRRMDISQLKETAVVLSKNSKISINDIMLSCSIGALIRFMKANNENEFKEFQKSTKNIAVIIPVNLRKTVKEHMVLGNKVGSFNVSFPVSHNDKFSDDVQENAIERVNIINKRMNQVKDTPEPYLAFASAKIVSYLPNAVASILYTSISKQVSLCVTNVPGVPSKGFFKYYDKEISDLIGFVPSPVTIGLGFSVFTYADKITVGLNVDNNVTNKPTEILDLFFDELSLLNNDLNFDIDIENQIYNVENSKNNNNNNDDDEILYNELSNPDDDDDEIEIEENNINKLRKRKKRIINK
eukprot:TRINITY_DN10104_c0_g4_i1.p1 TRINITY_DN10104_c0_g4~~TRINITY_DN10104_c0_g4_i1.p1  ORF type:complete len:532 (-),score=143.35 TRINITY_DN10104_c0_g4_i1:116-1711(-)